MTDPRLEALRAVGAHHNDPGVLRPPVQGLHHLLLGGDVRPDLAEMAHAFELSLIHI